MQNKIETIQVLRLFAAFSVMMVHLPLIEVGIWGVDIFFVISGFIMMYVTDINDRSFFLKRIIRIVPLYWILTLIIFVLALVKPELFNYTTANFEHLIKSLFFIPFNKNDTGHYPILFLGWTLNFEMIFYLLFGLSLIIFKKNKMYICSTMIIIFYFICLFLSEKNFIFQAYAYSIFFEFIYGMLAYLIWKKYSKIFLENKFYNILLLFLLIFSIIISITFEFPRFISLGVPSFFLVIYFLLFFNNLNYPKILVKLGDASYCIYLLHPYAIQFFYKIFDISKLNFFIEFLITLIIILIVFSISLLIFEFIEKPISNKLRTKLNV